MRPLLFYWQMISQIGETLLYLHYIWCEMSCRHFKRNPQITNELLIRGIYGSSLRY